MRLPQQFAFYEIAFQRNFVTKIWTLTCNDWITSLTGLPITTSHVSVAIALCGITSKSSIFSLFSVHYFFFGFLASLVFEPVTKWVTRRPDSTWFVSNFLKFFCSLFSRIFFLKSLKSRSKVDFFLDMSRKTSDRKTRDFSLLAHWKGKKRKNVDWNYRWRSFGVEFCAESVEPQ